MVFVGKYEDCCGLRERPSGQEVVPKSHGVFNQRAAYRKLGI